MHISQIRLEELQLIQCSLLPGENMEFVEEADFWNDALARSSESEIDLGDAASTAVFAVKVEGKPVWVQATVYMGSEGELVTVRGDNLSRNKQERWLKIIREKQEELEGTEYPLYNLLTQIVPMLHEAPLCESNEEQVVQDDIMTRQEPVFHVLFTSHHLVSTKKRRSLQQWTSSLKLSGFAKVGYPGVIYAQGTQENLEEFVSNVKAMQWLALRVRYVEPVPEAALNGLSPTGWQEFSRVGEVVEEMKRSGREEYVLGMGIGSNGSN